MCEKQKNRLKKYTLDHSCVQVSSWSWTVNAAFIVWGNQNLFHLHVPRTHLSHIWVTPSTPHLNLFVCVWWLLIHTWTLIAQLSATLYLWPVCVRTWDQRTMITQLCTTLYLYFVFVCAMFDVLMPADAFKYFQSLMLNTFRVQSSPLNTG